MSQDRVYIENELAKGTSYNSKNFCIHRYHCKKTYASAFAMRELGFQRALFLVHRNQIAKQAKKSFRKVFSGQVSMGLVTGKYQEYDKDFICKRLNFRHGY